MTWWKQLLEPLRGRHYKREYERECALSLHWKGIATQTGDRFCNALGQHDSELERLKQQIRELAAECSNCRHGRAEALAHCADASALVDQYKASAEMFRTALASMPTGEIPAEVLLTAEELEVAEKMRVTPRQYLENKGSRLDRTNAGIQLRNKLAAAKAAP